MQEQLSPPQPEEDRFGDYYDSPFLTFGSEIQVAGDPETEHTFKMALSYLELITERFIESGDFWSKTAADVNYRLSYYNERHKYEVEQEHKVGERSTVYTEITPPHLRALSERMLRALEDTGWEVTQAYRMACFMHALVEEAAASYTALRDLLEAAAPVVLLTPYAEEELEVPF